MYKCFNCACASILLALEIIGIKLGKAINIKIPIITSTTINSSRLKAGNLFLTVNFLAIKQNFSQT